MNTISRAALHEAARCLVVSEVQVREALTGGYRAERIQVLWAQADLLAYMLGDYQLAARIRSKTMDAVNAHLGPDDMYIGDRWVASDPLWREHVANELFVGLDLMTKPARTP